MISRGQQILVKRAQREAGLEEDDYRDALEAVSGCRSTRDARLTDRHVDLALAYFEAIYWRKIDSGIPQAGCKGDAVFRQRGYWASKNTREETSRDRFAHSTLDQSIRLLEAEMEAAGFVPKYCAAIRRKVTGGDTDLRSGYAYKAALERTLRAKKKNFEETIRI
jgi:hypothetical protein